MEAVGRQARGEVEPRPVKPQSNPGVSGRVACSDPEGPSASPSIIAGALAARPCAARTLLGRRLKLRLAGNRERKSSAFRRWCLERSIVGACLSVCLRIQKGGRRLCFLVVVHQTSEHLRRVSLAGATEGPGHPAAARIWRGRSIRRNSEGYLTC